MKIFYNSCRWGTIVRPYFLRKMSLGNRNGITVPVLCAFSYNVPAAPSALAAPSSAQPVALYLHAAYEKIVHHDYSRMFRLKDEKRALKQLGCCFRALFYHDFSDLYNNICKYVEQIVEDRGRLITYLLCVSNHKLIR